VLKKAASLENFTGWTGFTGWNQQRESCASYQQSGQGECEKDLVAEHIPPQTGRNARTVYGSQRLAVYRYK